MGKKSEISNYSKEQFLASKQFDGHQKDVLAAVLEDGRTYSIAEAEKAMQAYLRKEVK